MRETSKIDIWNMALARVGGAFVKQIDSRYEPSREAQMCELFYPQALRGLLSSHPFAFARKVTPLALKELAGVDAALTLPEGHRLSREGLHHDYAYPEDALKIWDVRAGHGPECAPNWLNHSRQYEVMTGQDGQMVIRTPLKQAHAMYSYMETDTTRYSPLFIEALQLALAQKLAGALSNNQQLAARLSQEAANALDSAMTDNASQSFRKTSSSEYIAAGYEGCHYGY